VRAFPLALTTVPERLALILARDGFLPPGQARPAVHVDTFQLTRDVVLRSDAIGAAIPAQIAQDVRAGRATILRLALPWLTSRYGFITLANRSLAPSVVRFMAEVRAVENELAMSSATAAAPSTKASRAAKHRRFR
jgi:hypothetical protein